MLAGPLELHPSRAVSGGGRGVASCPGAAFSSKKPSDANGFHQLRSPPKRTAACSPVSGVSLTMDGPAEAEKCVASYSVMPDSCTRDQSCAVGRYALQPEQALAERTQGLPGFAPDVGDGGDHACAEVPGEAVEDEGLHGCEVQGLHPHLLRVFWFPEQLPEAIGEVPREDVEDHDHSRPIAELTVVLQLQCRFVEDREDGQVA